jgi:hypothetical protein
MDKWSVSKGRIHTSRALMRQTGVDEEKWRKYLYY